MSAINSISLSHFKQDDDRVKNEPIQKNEITNELKALVEEKTAAIKISDVDNATNVVLFIRFLSQCYIYISILSLTVLLYSLPLLFFLMHYHLSSLRASPLRFLQKLVMMASFSNQVISITFIINIIIIINIF